MSTLLPVVNTKDLPSLSDEPTCAAGRVEEVEVTPSQSGEYQRVHLVVKHSTAAGERTAHIRFNLKPEWLTPQFAQRAKAGLLDDTEAIQYRINVAGLWRGLFSAAKLEVTDLNALVGRIIGFVVDYRYDKATGLPKNDAPEVQRFFDPAKLAEVHGRWTKAEEARKAKLGSGLPAAPDLSGSTAGAPTDAALASL